MHCTAPGGKGERGRAEISRKTCKIVELNQGGANIATFFTCHIFPPAATTVEALAPHINLAMQCCANFPSQPKISPRALLRRNSGKKRRDGLEKGREKEGGQGKSRYLGLSSSNETILDHTMTYLPLFESLQPKSSVARTTLSVSVLFSFLGKSCRGRKQCSCNRP